jgi:hypothetical protein
MKLSFPRPAQRSRAHALMAFLIVCGVVALMLAAYLSLMNNQGQLAERSQSWNGCIPMAEAGIEEALSHLNATRGVGLSSNGWTLDSGSYGKGRTLTEGNFRVSFTTNRHPVIDAVGQVRAFPGSNFITRRIRATTTNYFGTAGIITKGKVTVSGNTLIDSYNSADPRYSTGGQYDAAKAREHGYLATVSVMGQEMELKDNTKIKGDIGTGAAGVLKMVNPAVVGSAAYVANAANAGTVQPGHLSTDARYNFPVPVPVLGSSPVPDTITGNHNLPAGAYQVKNLTIQGMGGRLNVTGNASIYVEENFYLQDAAKIVISPGAELKLFVGLQIYFQGDSQANWGGQPSQFKVFGLSTSAQSYIQGNARIAGVLDAPNSKLDMNGAAELSGSAFVSEVVLQNDVKFHLDEALYGNGTGALYAINSWQEL